ncbi:YopX family protein [Enterococcus sp. DIV0183]|uniref:YopX family protein n=1 Tax=Enterococcus sp. DIV0183 TaxID=2774864 RepID=UPI003D2FE42F
MIPKFRVWDKNTNDMVDVKTIDLEKDGSIGCIVDYSNINLDASECILMQSTGLKDKNGVEIFEGDIVQYRDGEYSYLGIVKRDCYQFFIDGIEPDDNYGFIDVSNTFDGTSSLEVIGNIHENPELLEGTE